ncbi:MAG TPA: hypothetical protein VGQ52_08025 [Gemmatimonadaceae bacterium]|jgi:hypothetical protein|nr:hypothetical protein [Gemmatimonadaceae bacterium]
MTARIFAVLAVSIALADCQAPIQRFTVRDAATVQSILDSVTADIRESKWENLGKHFSDDAWFVAGTSVIGGQTAIVHWAKSLPRLESFSFGPAEVHGDAGLAYGWSPVYVKFKDVPADTARQLVVFRRGSDRRWVIQAISMNSDLPLPPSAHATGPERR